MTLYPIQDAFIRGEISPRLHSRASLDLYRGALSKCRNFLTMPHGGLRKASGTYFVAETKFPDRNVRLIDFKFSADQSYCLELGDGYCRVHAYGAYLGIEFATPWSHLDVGLIQYVQSADVMWLVHPNYPPHRITRRSASQFTVEIVPFVDGPFGPENADELRRAYVSAVEGAVTITASPGTFSPTDVGRLFRIEMESYTDIRPWEPGGVLGQVNEQIGGKRARYDGNVYFCVTSAANAGNGWRYGSTPPTHLKGVEPDGPIAQDKTIEAIVGANWAYLHSGFGVAGITGYISDEQVTANVISRFPEETVGAPNAAYRWSFGAFSPGNYPVATALFEERLVFANKLSVYASKTGDFDSFRVGEKDDDALQFLLAANEANDIVWLADADGFLAIGTIGGVRALSGSGLDEALTPSSFKNRSSSTPRCSRRRPLNTGQAFLYVANGDRTIAEMALNGSNRFEGSDAMQISEHIAKQGGGLIGASYQESPDPVAWFAMANGEAVGFTYQRDQDVRGFHRHSLSGSVQDVCVTPGRTGSDDVWFVVVRVINGVERRYIEMMQPAFEYQPKQDAFFVDSGLTYRGDPATVVGGLQHLEGQAVAALADGFEVYGLVVANGAVTLPRPARVVHVGVPKFAEAETLELDVGGRDGSIVGRRKRVTKVIFSLLETDLSGLKIESLIRERWEQAKNPSIAKTDGSVQLYTGNITVPIDDSWEGQGRIRIRHDGAGPCTIRSIIPAFDAEP